MNPDNNPFTPGQPVDAEFFTGRTKQVEELRAMVRMARKKKAAGWLDFGRARHGQEFSRLVYQSPC